MATSIKTYILDDIVTTIDAIVKGATYERTVRTAARSVKTLPQHPVYDVVYIERVTEDKEPYSNAATRVNMVVYLACFVEDRSDVATAIDNIATDIERALQVDVTRGGYAVDTWVTNTDGIAVEGDEPLGACLVQVQVEYRHATGNPYSAV